MRTPGTNSGEAGEVQTLRPNSKRLEREKRTARCVCKYVKYSYQLKVQFLFTAPPTLSTVYPVLNLNLRRRNSYMYVVHVGIPLTHSNALGF